MARLNKLFFNKKNHHPFLFNGILWICSFLLLLFAFSEDNHPEKIDVIYTVFFLITIIIPVLINLYIAIPLLLKKEKYFLFSLVTVVILIVFTQLNIWFFDNIIDKIFPEYYFISYHSNLKLILIFASFLLGTTLLKIFEDWIFLNKKENEKLIIENQQIQSKLENLRSQINPHFLFNSLNVIYSLALDKNDKTEEAIVQLSDILRYVIYDSNTNRVKLKEEIILLNNYINFQKFRFQKTKRIIFNADIENDNYPIYPMLLLPLVENSFKYATIDKINKPFINIALEQKGSEFNFTIQNNYEKEINPNKSNHSGVGIENIEKNLQIIYPEKHSFIIDKTNKEFKVSLKLFSNED